MAGLRFAVQCHWSSTSASTCVCVPHVPEIQKWNPINPPLLDKRSNQIKKSHSAPTQKDPHLPDNLHYQLQGDTPQLNLKAPINLLALDGHSATPL